MKTSDLTIVRRTALASIALLGLLAALPARAAPDADQTEAARARLSQGTQHLRQGEYAEALRSFQEAYELVPSPKIQFNLGLAYQGLARYAEAIEAFQKFLDDARPAPDDQKAVDARQLIDDLSRKVAKLEVRCACAGADVLLDGRVLGKMPLPHAVLVNPGSHQVAVQQERRSEVQRFEAVAGGAVFLTLALSAERPPVPLGTSAAPPPPPLSPNAPAVAVSATAGEPATAAPVYKRWWFWAAVGAAVAAGAVTFAIARRGHSADQPSLGTYSVGP